MSVEISANEKLLYKVFCDDYQFNIPGYQRPYAWDTENAKQLFEDLLNAFRDGSDEKRGNYFLGSIVLVKGKDDPKADVIDGQQRLTTLTILLSVLASMLEDDGMKREVKNFLMQEEKSLQGIPAAPRLRLREADQPFFEKYILKQNFAALNLFPGGSIETSSQKCLKQNCEAFITSIQQESDLVGENLTKFIRSILQKCYLVLVTTSDLSSAFRVFSVLNSRGMPLLTSDIIKAEIIGGIDAELRDEITKDWENYEQRIGRENHEFDSFFGHINVIYLRSKARRSTLEVFREKAMKKGRAMLEVYSETIVPYAEAHLTIFREENIKLTEPGRIPELLGALQSIGYADWMAPVLHFVQQMLGNDQLKHDSIYLQDFLVDFERLAAFLFITGKTDTQRMARFGRVIGNISENPQATPAEWSELQLTDEEKKQFRDHLEGDVYHLTRSKPRYLLQRLDTFLSETYEPSRYANTVTIEHVLPQNPEEGSEWLAWWTDPEREAWTHRLGNLALLSRRKNTQASNRSFKVKLETYFKYQGSTPFAITGSIDSNIDWTPEAVERRQKELLEVLCTNWKL